MGKNFNSWQVHLNTSTFEANLGLEWKFIPQLDMTSSCRWCVEWKKKNKLAKVNKINNFSEQELPGWHPTIASGWQTKFPTMDHPSCTAKNGRRCPSLGGDEVSWWSGELLEIEMKTFHSTETTFISLGFPRRGEGGILGRIVSACSWKCLPLRNSHWTSAEALDPLEMTKKYIVLRFDQKRANLRKYDFSTFINFNVNFMVSFILSICMDLIPNCAQLFLSFYLFTSSFHPLKKHPLVLPLTWIKTDTDPGIAPPSRFQTFPDIFPLIFISFLQFLPLPSASRGSMRAGTQSNRRREGLRKHVNAIFFKWILNCR